MSGPQAPLEHNIVNSIALSLLALSRTRPHRTDVAEIHLQQLRNDKMKNIIRIALAIVCIFCFSSLSASGATIDSLSVKPVNPEAEAITIYEVNFVLSDTLPSDAVITVTFPDGFDLSRVKLAGSSTINGGFKVSVEDSVVTITRTGLGREIPPGQKVEIKFGNVKNPTVPKVGYPISTSIWNRSGKRIAEEQISNVTIEPKS